MEHITEQLRELAVNISSLIPDPANARLHPDKNMSAIKASLRVYGQRKPIVVNKRNMVIEAGNGTYEAAKALGWSHIAAVLVDDDPTVAAGFSIADNRSAELAEWDSEALDKLMREVQTDDEELAGMLEELATDEDIISDDVTDNDAEPQIDRAAELQKKWGTATGQLWLIGEHRLLCGDSTKREDVERVMGGERAMLMATDPPYGVDFAGAKYNPKAKEWAAIDNDELQGDDLETFLAAFLASWLPSVDEQSGFYFWCAAMAEGAAAAAAIKKAGLHIQAQIIWNKNCLVLGQADYHWKHENCWYAFFKGKQHRWYGERDKTTVWEVDKVANSAYVHPMQKPTELYTIPMEHHTKQGDIVAEPFAGSGSQLVGAENMKRRCYAIEFSPNYCAVILERMTQAFPELEIRQAV